MYTVIVTNVCFLIVPRITMREKCPYSEFFWFVFSRIRTENGEIWCISPYSVQMGENTDQKSSEYGHFSHNVRSRTTTFSHKSRNFSSLLWAIFSQYGSISFTSQILEYLGRSGCLLKLPEITLENQETNGWLENLL